MCLLLTSNLNSMLLENLSSHHKILQLQDLGRDSCPTALGAQGPGLLTTTLKDPRPCQGLCGGTTGNARCFMLNIKDILHERFNTEH